MWSAALAMILLMSPGVGGAGKLPSFEHALRCAALTQAHAEKPALPEQEARIAFDQAIYWGMAASEVARAQKRSSAWFTAEQKRRAAQAQAQLSDSSGTARAELAACQAQVPKLPGPGE
jgi:hypothetical protein